MDTIPNLNGFPYVTFWARELDREYIVLYEDKTTTVVPVAIVTIYLCNQLFLWIFCSELI